jgi:K+-transporting ATPase ATPase C chain
MQMTPTAKKSAYRPAVAVAVLSLLICGILFPLLVTGVAQVAFPGQANGSLVQLGNRTVGSYYIDDGFTLPIFFHARNSSASASGVDPDIPLQDALSQIPRIHNAAGISVSYLTNLVMTHVEYTLFVTGDQYVNVLELNLALISGPSSAYSAYR